VISCQEADVARLGLLELRGDRASVEGVTSSVLMASDKLFYLGTDGDMFVLYNCKMHRSVTVENKDGIAVSVGL
jgi:hypothetical protein